MSFDKQGRRTAKSITDSFWSGDNPDNSNNDVLHNSLIWVVWVRLTWVGLGYGFVYIWTFSQQGPSIENTISSFWGQSNTWSLRRITIAVENPSSALPRFVPPLLPPFSALLSFLPLSLPPLPQISIPVPPAIKPFHIDLPTPIPLIYTWYIYIAIMAHHVPETRYNRPSSPPRNRCHVLPSTTTTSQEHFQQKKKRPPPFYLFFLLSCSG